MSRTDTKLHIGLTDAGKMILRGIGFVTLAALIIPAFGVLSALVSVMLTALVVGFILRPRIQVSGNLPDRIVVNQTVQLRYLLKNIAAFRPTIFASGSMHCPSRLSRSITDAWFLVLDQAILPR